MGHRNVLIMGFVKSWLSMLFLNVHHMIPKDNFLDSLKQVLLLDVLDEHSSWYNKVGDLCCQFGIAERKLCMGMDQHVRSVRPTPVHSAWSIALSAMVVECE